MKTSKEIEDHYAKFLIVYKADISNYFFKNLYPLLQDADGLYELLSKENEKLYNNFFDLYYQFYLEAHPSTEQTKKLRKELRYFLEKKIYGLIRNIMSQTQELYFDGLTTYKEGIKILKQLILKIPCFTYLNLSGSILDEKELISIIDSIETKDQEFTLEIKNMELSKKILMIIKDVQRTFLNKKFIIDNKYNGAMNDLNIRKIRNKDKIKQKTYLIEK